MSEWLFADPPNVAVFADKRIIYDGAWIAQAWHDLDDRAWQFFAESAESLQEGDVALVSLHEILLIDASVNELADLPLGWKAWRESVESAWRRARIV